MNAREMFEKLGYRRSTDIDMIKYSKELDDRFYLIKVMFDLSEKEVVLDNNGYEAYIITCSLLKAINKQCEELGWIEEEKQEIKQETNFEYYKDEILECCIDDLAVVKGIPKPCSKTDCNDCDFLTIQKDCHEIAKDWIKQTHIKPKYKLTKFEFDFLDAHKDSGMQKCISNHRPLLKLHENGYFKDIDTSTPIHEILDNCEVVG